MADKTKTVLKTFLVILFWIFIWALCALGVGKDILLPSPRSVLSAFSVLCREPSFYLSVLYSVARVSAGFILGCFFGILFAVLAKLIPGFRTLTSPILSAVRSTPVASFIILALVLMGRNLVPSFISFLMVFPIIWGGVSTGIDSASPELLEVARVFEFSRAKTLRLVYLPAVEKYFISSSVTAIGLAWKAGISAEVLATPKMSMGSALYDSKVYLESPSLFAWTLVIVLLSIGFEKLFKLASRIILRRLSTEGIK